MVKFSQLKKLEHDAIQTICTQGPFFRLNTLNQAALGAQTKVNSGPKTPIDVSLSFTLPTRLREDAGHSAIERAFHVGGIVCPGENDEIAHLSYSVLICKDAHPGKHVARKFHFDYEPASGRSDESKPTFHLQLCGELSRHHAAVGYTEDDISHLLPAWSQPRVPAQPMSLALVLNWLFIEFGRDPSVSAARLNPRWQSLVRDTERTILKPYFDACSAFLAAARHEDDSFYSALLYEEA